MCCIGLACAVIPGIIEWHVHDACYQAPYMSGNCSVYVVVHSRIEDLTSSISPEAEMLPQLGSC